MLQLALSNTPSPSYQVLTILCWQLECATNWNIYWNKSLKFHMKLQQYGMDHMTYHWMFNMNNTKCATSGAEIAYFRFTWVYSTFLVRYLLLNLLVKEDMDVNRRERLFNIKLRHKFKWWNMAFTDVLHFSHSKDLNNEQSPVLFFVCCVL